MLTTATVIHDDFITFVEAIVLPRLLGNPGATRLDGNETQGNWEVAGYFRHDGAVWRAHEDNHYEPLLLAYYAAKYGGRAEVFCRADTAHGVRLDLVPELQDLRPTRRRYMYLYLEPNSQVGVLSQLRGLLDDELRKHALSEAEIQRLICEYGAACFRAQVLEMELRLMLLADDHRNRPADNGSDASRTVGTPIHETLGMLVRRAGQRNLVTSAVLHQLEGACKARNQLIHHLLLRIVLAIGKKGGWGSLIDECQRTASQLDEAGKALVSLVEAATRDMNFPAMTNEQLLQELFPAEA